MCCSITNRTSCATQIFSASMVSALLDFFSRVGPHLYLIIGLFSHPVSNFEYCEVYFYYRHVKVEVESLSAVLLPFSCRWGQNLWSSTLIASITASDCLTWLCLRFYATKPLLFKWLSTDFKCFLSYLVISCWCLIGLPLRENTELCFGLMGNNYQLIK